MGLISPSPARTSLLVTRRLVFCSCWSIREAFMKKHSYSTSNLFALLCIPLSTLILWISEGKVLAPQKLSKRLNIWNAGDIDAWVSHSVLVEQSGGKAWPPIWLSIYKTLDFFQAVSAKPKFSQKITALHSQAPCYTKLDSKERDCGVNLPMSTPTAGIAKSPDEGLFINQR